MLPDERLTPADVEGLTLGPVVTRPDPERIEAFVAATGDDPERWAGAAPPGYAAALLFRVAGGFLWDPRLSDERRTLLHVDQEFGFRRPIPVGVDLAVTGTVQRVRRRGEASFVTFVAEVRDGADVVLGSRSTFLMSPEAASDPGPDPGEPPAVERGITEVPEAVTLDRLSSGVSLAKSASREDLVRYAAATGDLNPIHWDHDAARDAGLPGVVVHGLLLHSWMSQLASVASREEQPIVFMKTRFRQPLRPAQQATVTAGLKELAHDGKDAALALAVESGGETLVSAAATVRLHTDVTR